MERASESLRVTDITHRYHSAGRAALSGVSFFVPPGRTLAIIGPSGAGKSTLLRTIAGLNEPSSGEIVLGSRDVRTLPVQERRIALVFQTDALFAHMNVRANLRFALRSRSRAADVESLAVHFELEKHLDRMPGTLSGGERQRVAIVRALLSEPAALLLDEPLAHLDPELRARVRNELISVRDWFDGPIVYVTHDHAEALAIADELLVLIDGAVEDSGDAQRVYDAPRTLRSASFLGERPMNLIVGLDDNVVTGVRPEHVRVDPGGAIAGCVTRRELTGPDAYLHVRTALGNVVARVGAADEHRAGAPVRLAFDERDVRRFDPASGVAIPTA